MFYLSDFFTDEMIKLVQECNKIVLDIYNTDFSTDYKDDNTPLTLADTECNKYICEYLSKYKHTLIISEENKSLDFNFRNKYDYCWLIDPIDGTKEFIKKNGQFTINIGLSYKGTPVYGIVSIPVTGEIYYGGKDLGSYKIKNNEKIKLEIKKNKDYLQEKLNIVASVSHLNDETKKFISLFKKPNIIGSGSSIKLLLIAEGKADIYPRLGLTSEWDTCAAHAIVKYAGGNVILANSIKSIYDLTRDKKELIYNKEDILNPYFIVY